MSQNPKLTAESIYKYSQIEWILEKLESLPEERFIPLFSEWAAENRYLGEGVTDLPGMWDPTVAPHLVQPLNDLHPDSPYRIVTNIKSVQSMNTVSIAENALGAYIRYKIGSVLFLTSNQNIADIRGSANIDTMIDDSGLAKYMGPASNRTGKKSKDGTTYKEFSGGLKFLMTSYGSIGDIKSNTFHLIIEDELDEAGTDLKDQGDIEETIAGRTLGVSNWKILQISTSSRAETSRIWRNYQKGDQNEYFVPCPICGFMQILTLMRSGDKYGLTHRAETDKKTGKKMLVPGTIKYICKDCKKDFYETKKEWMLNNGVWRPQATPQNPLHRSYWSRGLIAPALSWERIINKFIECDYGKGDLLVFKAFVINYLGEPWSKIKKASDWEKLRDRAEDYCLGEVPEGQIKNISGFNVYCGGLVLFSGCDVQKDRLEVMTTAFGPNSEKWIVDYKVFFGDTKNINDPCWNSLQEYIYTKNFEICGVKTNQISCCAIDAGYNPGKGEAREKDFANKAHVVYEFCSIRPKFIAVMGNPKPNDSINGILKPSKITDTKTTLSKRYLISVSMLKEVIMDAADQTEGFGTIHLPRYQVNMKGEKEEIPDSFYQGFLSERLQENPKRLGTEIWHKFYDRNEPLDTYIYSVGASEFFNISSSDVQTWASYYNDLIQPD